MQRFEILLCLLMFLRLFLEGKLVSFTFHFRQPIAFSQIHLIQEVPWESMVIVPDVMRSGTLETYQKR